MKHATLVACAVAALSLLSAVTAEDDPNAAVPGVLDLGMPSAADARLVSHISEKVHAEKASFADGALHQHAPYAFPFKALSRACLCAIGIEATRPLHI